MDRTSTLALLCRTVDYGETDRICTLLTLELGKISALARGARRSRKRFGGALALFVVGEAVVRPSRRGGELMALELFDCVEDLGGQISTDVVKVAHGSYVLELARELCPPGQPEPRVFDLVCRALRALAHQEPSPMLLRAYELQVLGASGLAPSLDRCASCGNTTAGDALFSVAQGGLTCRRCAPPDGIELPPEVCAALLALQISPLENARGVAADGATSKRLRDVMLATIRHALGKELRSVEFILQLGAGRAGR